MADLFSNCQKDSGIWKLDEWKQFASSCNLKWVVIDGCAVGLASSTGAPLRKPRCLQTHDIRIINFFSQFVCPGNHVHAETMGKNAKVSAFYTEKLAQVLIECWHPQLWYKNTPANTMSSNQSTGSGKEQFVTVVISFVMPGTTS